VEQNYHGEPEIENLVGGHLPTYSVLQEGLQLLQFPFFNRPAWKKRFSEGFIEGN
jgi:hypothetical protein